jgi:AraC family transcriptional activator of mtrCDE
VAESLFSNPSDLNDLLARLEVNVVQLADCLIGHSWRMSFEASQMAGLHYVISGSGEMTVSDGAVVPLTPCTLVIVPPNQAFEICVPAKRRGLSTRKVGAPDISPTSSDSPLRVATGDEKGALIMLCGYFRACFGVSVDLFSTLLSPIVDRLGYSDQAAFALQALSAELASPRLGVHSMTTSLLKQVLVELVRRSFHDPFPITEKFLMLSDREIVHVLARMVKEPTSSFSTQTLSQLAGLSRSVFMARFTKAMRHSPMGVLRQLRMKQASLLLADEQLTIEDVAQAVGYLSRSSFYRAFSEVHGTDPSTFRSHRSGR